ncbi:MAG TPA: efflux RND transporter periplasmic adaptor subunit [Bryobacteraceae bacterium]|nr:efflux RND transporter periplasmic adaptor subunit [Bryobacteraceae bacterium]
MTNKAPRLSTPILLLGAAYLVVTGCTNTGVKAGGPGGRGRGAETGPVPVVVATVSQRDVPINVDVIGNVEAYSTITVKAQVGGELTKVSFREGDFVKKGDLLFTIDGRPLEAQLSQAQANLARDTAGLSQAQANLARDVANEKYAQDQAKRYLGLFDQGVVSREQADQMGSSAAALSQTVLADKAAIESARAQIVADKAAVENVQVQLSYTTILSPIDGRTGSIAVKQGNVVAANTTDLMTITQVQPIYVTFSVPEDQLGEIKRYMGEGQLPVHATSQADAGIQESGMLTFVDNSVDATTGTIKLKGTFKNAENKLWPGEFVRVVLGLTTHPHATVVPNQAVQTGQDGQFVYVVKPDQTVEMRPVVTSTRVDQDLVIDRGLEPGETVVTEGQLRLTPGSRVQIQASREAGDVPIPSKTS